MSQAGMSAVASRCLSVVAVALARSAHPEISKFAIINFNRGSRIGDHLPSMSPFIAPILILCACLRGWIFLRLPVWAAGLQTLFALSLIKAKSPLHNGEAFQG